MTINLNAITSAQAIRSTVSLEPINGPGGRIYPPTYLGERPGDPARHVVETLPDNSKRVLVDSVASQANRQEQALVAARSAGRINFSDVYIDLRDTDADLEGFMRGGRWAGEALVPDLFSSSVEDFEGRYETPIFFLMGRNDLHTPYEPAKAFFESSDAELKKFIKF